METSLKHADERDLIETFVERSRWHMPMTSLMSGATTVFGHRVCPDALTGFRR